MTLRLSIDIKLHYIKILSNHQQEIKFNLIDDIVLRQIQYKYEKFGNVISLTYIYKWYKQI